MRPSLVLDFTTGLLDPRINVASRASRAWRYDHRGLLVPTSINTPRINYDPVTGACRGLLAEESQTNQLRYSEQFDNAVWVPTSLTVTANTHVAPDGTTTMDTLNSNGNADIYQNVAAGGATTQCASVVVSSESTSTNAELVIWWYAGGVTDKRILTFNPQTGQILGEDGWATARSYGVEPLANGLYRFHVAATGTDAANTQVRHQVSDRSGVASTLIVWGAQLEQSEFPTSYIPTTSAAVTRAADRITLPLGEWFNESEGTIFARFAFLGSNGLTNAVWSLTDGTSANRIELARNSSNVVNPNIVRSGSAEVSFNHGTLNTAAETAVAFAWKGNDCASSMNGGAVQTDMASVLPSGLTELALGHRVGTEFGNIHIRRLVYWPKRLSNTDLQALTA